MKRTWGFLDSVLVLVIVMGVHGCSGKNPGGSPTPQPGASGEPASPEKVQQTIQQVKTIIDNAIRWKGQGHSYKELDTKRAIADGIVPKEMLNENGGMKSPWGGPASIDTSPLPGPETFTILFSSVPNRDCVQVALQAKDKFTVYAGKWGPAYEARGEARATEYCTTGNMWFLPK